MKHSHCSWCGARFAEGAAWPRRCAACGRTSFLNPLPVAVVIQPVDDGVLLVRRAIEPRRGELVFPGGFIDHAETWQEAAARELVEETGVIVDPSSLGEYRVRSAPDGTLLVFALAPKLASSALPPFVPTPETSERVVATDPVELGFPIHSEILREYLSR